MGTPRSKNVSSDIASDVEDSKLNEKIAFITFVMVVQLRLMGAQHMLLVAQHMLMGVQHMLVIAQQMLRVVHHMCVSVRLKLSQLPTKLKLKLKLSLAIFLTPLYLTNISTMYHQNQGHIPVI